MPVGMGAKVLVSVARLALKTRMGFLVLKGPADVPAKALRA